MSHRFAFFDSFFWSCVYVFFSFILLIAGSVLSLAMPFASVLPSLSTRMNAVCDNSNSIGPIKKIEWVRENGYNRKCKIIERAHTLQWTMSILQKGNRIDRRCTKHTHTRSHSHTKIMVRSHRRVVYVRCWLSCRVANSFLSIRFTHRVDKDANVSCFSRGWCLANKHTPQCSRLTRRTSSSSLRAMHWKFWRFSPVCSAMATTKDEPNTKS